MLSAAVEARSFSTNNLFGDRGTPYLFGLFLRFSPGLSGFQHAVDLEFLVRILRRMMAFGIALIRAIGKDTN